MKNIKRVDKSMKENNSSSKIKISFLHRANMRMLQELKRDKKYDITDIEDIERVKREFHE